MGDTPHPVTPKPAPWAPLGATRVGGAIGALIGVTAVVNYGPDAAWAMLVSAVAGALVGFHLDRHNFDRPPE